jgi:hypothetical protein
LLITRNLGTLPDCVEDFFSNNYVVFRIQIRIGSALYSLLDTDPYSECRSRGEKLAEIEKKKNDAKKERLFIIKIQGMKAKAMRQWRLLPVNLLNVMKT